MSSKHLTQSAYQWVRTIQLARKFSTDASIEIEKPKKTKSTKKTDASSATAPKSRRPKQSTTAVDYESLKFMGEEAAKLRPVSKTNKRSVFGFQNETDVIHDSYASSNVDEVQDRRMKVLASLVDANDQLTPRKPIMRTLSNTSRHLHPEATLNNNADVKARKKRERNALMMQLQYMHADTLTNLSDLPTATQTFIHMFQYLKTFGFTDQEIIGLAQRYQRVFHMDVDHNIAHKVHFFVSVGCSMDMIKQMFIQVPQVFTLSLKHMAEKVQYFIALGLPLSAIPHLVQLPWMMNTLPAIITRLDILRALGATTDDLINLILIKSSLLSYSLNTIRMGVMFMIKQGFPLDRIMHVLLRTPGILLLKPEQLYRLARTFEMLLGVSMDQFYSSFLGRYPQLSHTTPKALYRMFRLLGSFGLSPNEMLVLLRNQGTFLSADIRHLASKIEYVTAELNVPLALPMDVNSRSDLTHRTLPLLKSLHENLGSMYNVVVVRNGIPQISNIKLDFSNTQAVKDEGKRIRGLYNAMPDPVMEAAKKLAYMIENKLPQLPTHLLTPNQLACGPLDVSKVRLLPAKHGDSNLLDNELFYSVSEQERASATHLDSNEYQARVMGLSAEGVQLARDQLSQTRQYLRSEIELIERSDIEDVLDREFAARHPNNLANQISTLKTTSASTEPTPTPTPTSTSTSTSASTATVDAPDDQINEVEEEDSADAIEDSIEYLGGKIVVTKDGVTKPLAFTSSTTLVNDVASDFLALSQAYRLNNWGRQPNGEFRAITPMSLRNNTNDDVTSESRARAMGNNHTSIDGFKARTSSSSHLVDVASGAVDSATPETVRAAKEMMQNVSIGADFITGDGGLERLMKVIDREEPKMEEYTFNDFEELTYEKKAKRKSKKQAIAEGDEEGETKEHNNIEDDEEANGVEAVDEDVDGNIEPKRKVSYYDRIAPYNVLFATTTEADKQELLSAHIPKISISNVNAKELLCNAAAAVIKQKISEIMILLQNLVAKGGEGTRTYLVNTKALEKYQSALIDVEASRPFKTASFALLTADLVRGLLGQHTYQRLVDDVVRQQSSPMTCLLGSKSSLLLLDEEKNVMLKVSSVHAMSSIWTSVMSRMVGIKPQQQEHLTTLRLPGARRITNSLAYSFESSPFSSSSFYSFLNLYPGLPHTTALGAILKNTPIIYSSFSLRMIPRMANTLLRSMGHRLDSRVLVSKSYSEGYIPSRVEIAKIEQEFAMGIDAARFVNPFTVLTNEEALANNFYEDQLIFEPADPNALPGTPESRDRYSVIFAGYVPGADVLPERTHYLKRKKRSMVWGKNQKGHDMFDPWFVGLDTCWPETLADLENCEASVAELKASTLEAEAGAETPKSKRMQQKKSKENDDEQQLSKEVDDDDDIDLLFEDKEEPQKRLVFKYTFEFPEVMVPALGSFSFLPQMRPHTPLSKRYPMGPIRPTAEAVWSLPRTPINHPLPPTQEAQLFTATEPFAETLLLEQHQNDTFFDTFPDFFHITSTSDSAFYADSYCTPQLFIPMQRDIRAITALLDRARRRQRFCSEGDMKPLYAQGSPKNHLAPEFFAEFMRR